MSKRLLMLSTATVALFTSAALAQTTLTSSDSKTTPYTTGAKASTDDTSTVENAGNFTIQSGGSVTITGLAQAAIKLNKAPVYTGSTLTTASSWLLNQGTITAKDKDGTAAIRVDMSVNPDVTGTSMTVTTGSSSTQSNTAIYLDGTSITQASGSGTGKVGLYLDNSSCSSATCTLTGNITTAAGSQLAVSGGDSSIALQIGAATSTATNYAVLKGDLNVGGYVTATSDTTTNTATNMFAIASYGKIDGNVVLATGSQVTSYGHGGFGLYLAGMGVTGSVQLNGALTSSVNVSSNPYNYTQKINTTTNPEAGPALAIGASVGGGITIGSPTVASASVTMHGSSAAIVIGSLNGSLDTTNPLIIGEYKGDSADAGFSFYNRGTVTAQYTNYNKSVAAMQITGASATAQTILTGGFFTSGSLSATAQTSNDATTSDGVTAYGVVIGDNTRFEPNVAAKADSSPTSPGDDAALVVSGSNGAISASVSGTRGGTARALWIYGAATSVPSIINTGKISASALTTNAALGGGTASTQPISGFSTSSDPLAAIAIQDDTGTLVSVVNSGTISAVAGYSASLSTSAAGALDNNKQVAVAIKLGTSDNQTIQNIAYGGNATIVGNVMFGSGSNQLLDVYSKGAYYSLVIGDISFGTPVGSVIASGDRLHVGYNGYVSGKVTTSATVAGSGVQVDVDNGGTLNLLNTTTALSATSVTVQNGGTLSLGVNRQLTTSGMIRAQSISFADGSTLGVNYASFLPASAQASGTYQFVLMTADPGQLQIAQNTLNAFNSATNTPYLLKTATMCVTSQLGCTKPSDVYFSTHDALLIDVVAKTPAEIGLTSGSVATAAMANVTAGGNTTLFQQANLALAIDDELGAAFIKGITDKAQAQKAYNDMAPGITGGTRAIAISITDSATGPVAARQRALRMYGKTNGDFTLWGQEFVQMLKDPGTGAIDPNTGFKTNPGFKDHGFGIAVGLDGGSPKYGWYGGALTFYAGDVNELSRNAHQNQQWYLLSLYSDWRGKGLFLDTKVDVGYGHIDGKRTLALLVPDSTGTTLTPYSRTAENKHAGALLSGSIATGAMFTYGAATFMPQFNLDGLYLREEGYTENNPSTTTVGDGFDLKVNQYYAKSLRAFVGLDMRYDFHLWDFYLQPEARAGYRYDFVSDPVKLKAAFAYSHVTTNTITAGDTFELTGPDPSQGNFVLGGTLSATTNAWTLGLNVDLVRGSNGAFQQVGTLHILGRI